MASALRLRAATSRQPLAADPCRGISDPGASSRGLKASTRRLLVRLGNDARDKQPLKLEPVTAASAGTVLVRDWHGTAHEVRVLDRGVLYKRKRYRSLTEVAKLITGAHWNGPRFFGLRSKREQEASHGQK